MQIRPIASALTRNKTGLVLIALQIALTLAIVCNSVFIIVERLDKMGRPSGVDEQNLFIFDSVPFAVKPDMAPGTRADLEALRAMPGVADAVSANSVPLSNGGWSSGISKKRPKPEGGDTSDADSSVYLLDEHGVSTLGLKLIAGRDFTADDVSVLTQNGKFVPRVTIVSKALAAKLFPDDDALGKQVWGFGSDEPQTIVGIVDTLQAPWQNWKKVDFSMLVPALVTPPNHHYVVRAKSGQRDAVMRDIESRMRAVDDQRIVHEMKDYAQIRSDAYRRDRAMAIMLVCVIVCLLVITGLGIVGMASFWVTSRTKQIGTRRALGARRVDVLRYFQVENFLITAAGLAVGALLAYGFNVWLMNQYDLPRLAWWYVPAGALALWALGQAAVLGPALRGASVPPAVATRTV